MVGTGCVDAPDSRVQQHNPRRGQTQPSDLSVDRITEFFGFVTGAYEAVNGSNPLTALGGLCLAAVHRPNVLFQLCTPVPRGAPNCCVVTEREEHRKLGLEVLFGVLDFAGCTKNRTAWQYLAKYLRQTLMG